MAVIRVNLKMGGLKYKFNDLGIKTDKPNREFYQMNGAIKIKPLLSRLIIVTILILFVNNTTFADSTVPENSPPSDTATDQDLPSESNPPIWFSLASDGKNQSVGFLGRRIGDKNKDALELVAIFNGENKGYGFDYSRFFDLSDTSAWYLGIGGYSIFSYFYDNNNTITKSQYKISLAVGYQKKISNFLLGLGLNTVRGIYVQIGMGF